MGSSPILSTICACAGIGRQASLRCWCFGVWVRVPPCTPTGHCARAHALVGCLFRQLHSISSLGWLPVFHQYINEAGLIRRISSSWQSVGLSLRRLRVRTSYASPEWFPVPHLLLGNNTSDHNPGECPKRKKKTVGFIPNSNTPISERTRDRVANGIGVKSVWPEQSGA